MSYQPIPFIAHCVAVKKPHALYIFVSLSSEYFIINLNKQLEL